MKICITAANCFIGLPLVKKAAELGWEVIAVVRVGNKQKDFIATIQNTKVIELNLEDYDQLGALVGPVDCAVLLTWNGTRGKARLDDELQKTNYENNMKAVKSLIDYGCKRIITAGSQAEYGISNEMISEKTECKPNTAYGKYKVLFYKDAYNYCKENKVSLKEPRFFSLYGPGDYENTLIMSNIKKMRANETCDMTPCTQMWDYLFVDDAIEGIIGLCHKECDDGAYNFGSGDCRQLKDFVQEMKSILKSDSKLNFGTVPYTAAGIVSIQPDIHRLKSTGWKPKVSFKDGVEKIVKAMEK